MSKRCRHISVRLNPDGPKHVHIIDVLDDLHALKGLFYFKKGGQTWE